MQVFMASIFPCPMATPAAGAWRANREGSGSSNIALENWAGHCADAKRGGPPAQLAGPAALVLISTTLSHRRHDDVLEQKFRGQID
jgi:hypothetical protein